jgi:hypothetical protein
VWRRRRGRDGEAQAAPAILRRATRRLERRTVLGALSHWLPSAWVRAAEKYVSLSSRRL